MLDERKPPTTLSTSPRGRAFITDWEGKRLKAYLDSANIPTIGVGHIRGVRMGMTITDAQCDAFLREDLHEAELVVRHHVKVPLTQAEFDALVSWEFNTGALVGSTLLRRLNAGRYDLVDNEMRRWNKATDPKTKKKIVVPGLTARRLSESELWATGDYRTRNETTAFWESNTQPMAPVVKESDKPLAKRKSVQGSAIASVGVAGSAFTDAANQVSIIADYGDTIRLVFIALTLIGVGLTVYAAIQNHRQEGM